MFSLNAFYQECLCVHTYFLYIHYHVVNHACYELHTLRGCALRCGVRTLSLCSLTSTGSAFKPSPPPSKAAAYIGQQGYLPEACKRKDIDVGGGLGGDKSPEENRPPKKPRLVFTDIQRRTLHAIFKETKRPSKEMQQTIAQQLGLEVTTVANFFMNARRRSLDKWQDDNGNSQRESVALCNKS
ncbi:one cut domain family member [Plakobranchus ocellatus]|uniref:One cut domain family member n=1 Tax=Plakobranchus ocellatus TaxID=259542 RepID=A0AAV3ZZY4_9GAST|nr:one cut domain family member [Plakobranchus ocellatus]